MDRPGDSYVGEVLVRRGVVSAARLGALLGAAPGPAGGADVRRLVAAVDAETDAAVARALAAEASLPYLEAIDVEAVPTEAAARLPLSYARARQVLVLGESAASVRVALADPFDVATLDDLRALFGKPVEPRVSAAGVVRAAINRAYERAASAGAPSAAGLPSGAAPDDGDAILRDLLEAPDDEAPVIRWVNGTLARAVREGASDVHLEPRRDELLVRYRVDGHLRVAGAAPRRAAGSIVARIKVMAGLNLAERRLPQSGRAALVVAGQGVDVRVETSPAVGGAEAAVMRLLRQAGEPPTLDGLGIGRRDARRLCRLVAAPHGLVLVTGPTGSGKTTTLYACLSRINAPERKIVTAEDPVEYRLDGVHQVHVRPAIGLTFAGALRSFLRQDPDVMMVGEVRDRETAEVATAAALTGHLVLSTVHTNDAAGAVARLVDLGVEPFLVRSALRGVLAQRLVRTLCPHCKVRDVPSPGELARLGLGRDAAAREGGGRRRGDPAADGARPAGGAGGAPAVFRARGCERCAGVGYRGRTGIYELLVVDDAVGALVAPPVDVAAVRRAALARGMTSLRDDGVRKALAGVTSVDEVLAATCGGR